MKRMTKALCLSLGVFLPLAGCTSLAPQYTRPAAPVAAAWPNGPAYGANTDGQHALTTAETSWQDFFTDANLRRLITLALENNRDLKVAVLNIQRTQAQYQIQRAGLLPQVDASGGASVQRVPEDLTSSGKARTDEQYNVNLGVSGYELDLFGRVQSLKDQALAQYLASEQAQRSARISLVSQMAMAWLNLASDRQRLQLAKETLRSNRETLEITQQRVVNGIASEIALHQARTSVEASRVEIARLTRQVAEDENGLRLLAGTEIPAELLNTPPLQDITALREIAPGLPSAVLQQRPDILQAENLLQGYNANIGAARAAFFPRITLVGATGSASDELTGLFKDGSLTWSFAPKITLPIFNAGANKARLEVAETDRAIALAGYERAVQTAFREVADALAARGTIVDQMAAQQALADAVSQTHRLAETRFEQGVDSFLSVLDAQRSLYAAQQNLITIRLARLTNQVTLYKVLGGGAQAVESQASAP